MIYDHKKATVIAKYLTFNVKLQINSFFGLCNLLLKSKSAKEAK